MRYSITTDIMSFDSREKWKHKLEFLFTELGHMIGLGNIWRFPYKCYMYGGGTFLIPYTLTVLLCGIPVLFLETFLGQFASTGAITIWNVSPIFKGIGWAVMLNIFMVTIYYSVIVMYALYYMIVSFANIGGDLPWTDCGQHWTTEKCRYEPVPNLETSAYTDTEKNAILRQMMDPKCLEMYGGHNQTYQELNANFGHCLIQFTSPEEEYWNRFILGVHESKGFDDLGAIQGRNAFCLLIVWIVNFYCCQKGIRSLAKVRTIFHNCTK